MHRILNSAFLPLLVLAAPTRAQVILYVDADAPGANNGSSWQNAYTDLQLALDRAEATTERPVEIRVAEGEYFPTVRGYPDDPRSASFVLTESVALYGGFAGFGSADPNARDASRSRTILSGALGPNVRNVVFIGGQGVIVKISGFTIRGGRTDYEGAGLIVDSASVVVEDCTFVDNVGDAVPGSAGSYADGGVAHGGGSGAAVSVTSSDTAVFRSCLFERNLADGNGGAIVVRYVDRVTFDRCVFVNNRAGGAGGAVFLALSNANMEIAGCSFQGNSASNGAAVFFNQLHFPVAGSVTGSRFLYNHATEDGGALLIQGADASFQIRNSEFRENTSSAGGGALFVEGDAQVENCLFEQNEARETAGAAFVNGSTRFVDCTFSLNVGDDGGGIGMATNTTASVSRCRFHGNNAYRGGAVENAGTLLVDQTEFLANDAVEGGAVYNLRPTGFVMEDSVLEENYATTGGGIANTGCAGTQPCGILVRRCRFLGNAAELGGAWWQDSMAIARIEDTVLLDNAAALGGAIAHDYGASIVLNRCTLADNSATILGGAVLATDGMRILSSILWGNRVGPFDDPAYHELAQVAGLSSAQVDYSIVQGWSGTYAGLGNTNADPLFVGPTGADGPYQPAQPDVHQRSSSPAINAGDPGYASDLTEGDLDGHARVLCGRVDMGAYEFGIGDFNCDRITELADFAAWPACMTGPVGEGVLEAPLFPEGCEAFEFNPDGAIDLQDYAGYQRISLSP